MNFIQSLLPAIEHFHMLGYWIAFLAALFETTIGVGFFLPGSTIILLMGALAAKGYFGVGDLLWFAIAGAILGDNLNYFIGKKYGSKIFSKGFWFIKPRHFKKGEEFFEKYGSKSVFIGRFIPSIKEIIPLIAGTLGMKRLPFMIWNILGATGWSFVWVLSGYFFVQSLDLAKIWLTRAGFLLTTLTFIFIIFYILKIIFIKKGKIFLSFLSSLWQSIKQSIIENSEVQKFNNKHKTLLKFIQKRLDKNNFYGLPFTLFSLALFYALFLFGGVAKNIINSDLIVSTDIRVANLLAIFRNIELTKFFFWITLLGKSQVILIFLITAILILWIWKKRFYIITLLLSIMGSGFFTYIGKLIFHRARPSVAVYTENSFSFPSGHATIAIAFYGFLAYLLIKSAKQWKQKINIFFISFILIILIGFSRLYLGVHYVSDIWGGYLSGAIWLIIAIGFSEYFSQKQKTVLSSPNLKKYLLTIGILSISLCLYIIFALNYQIPALTTSQKIKQTTVSDITNTLNTKQLKYTETLLGDKQEPLSFIIIAKNDQQLISLFTQAGWTLADDINIFSVVKSAKALLWKKFYPKAPITPDFWNSEVHNFGFEKATHSKSIRTRHHARFWKTNYITQNKKNIYVGTASFDNNIKWGVTHKINPNIDKEREFLLNSLQNTGMLASAKKQQFVNPKIGSNFSGDLFFTDGKLYLIFVKNDKRKK
ncbi:MAG: phosphatase PAP2 family protein [Xanthomonadaceae bacterium]|nr:phosphatase PAP2 family protein [Rhodospirillaceae bacterium]NIA18087.1 phosphatase PAP2 family protein [Xanthomonadaceae bacterium]